MRNESGKRKEKIIEPKGPKGLIKVYGIIIANLFAR